MRLMTNILLVLGTLLLASGCASAPQTEIPDPVIVTEYIRADCGTPPKRQDVNLRAFEWLIIDDRFTLSAKGYEDLSYNVTVILAGIRELQAEIDFYERCLSSSEQRLGISSDSSE